ncbi:saccharopine dehydrogenase family protein [Actinocorallia populi]|uniref:saccharopine dehydrogenase NADP-binding domain-containing protein n=1 Tax=Actinocorallia populi TaxID=2079200 RepID=UPI000D08806C|nr:saccharopine dehydrogenase NADP-binding domain-containing protein [Actinocorallia populi]
MTSVISGRVLVAGGYGAVGSAVSAALGEWLPGRVVPGGRNAERAREHGGVRVDVTDPGGFRRVLEELGDVAAVVLCVEPPDVGIARACLENGVHLVDVGATPKLVRAVSGLHGKASAAGATGVLSVGVAPGLTNLLARRAHEAVGGAERLDLTVLLGSGERHGGDAVRWTVEGLAEPATARARRAFLPGHGTRTAHPFPFSDQHTLPHTLGVPDVTTRLCLDSRPLTAALFALRRAARTPSARRLLTAAFQRVHLGGDSFAIRADARNADRTSSHALTGNGQSRVTGLVAAHVTRALMAGTLPPGVHHIEELPSLAGLLETLAAEEAVALHPGS